MNYFLILLSTCRHLLACCLDEVTMLWASPPVHHIHQLNLLSHRFDMMFTAS